jgi:hypothetical protein
MVSSPAKLALRSLMLGMLLLEVGCATKTDTAKIPNADDYCDGRTVLGSHIKKKTCTGNAGSAQDSLNSWELQRTEQTMVRPDH